MAFRIADRVQESSTTAGTSDLSLGGAATGFRTFGSVLSNGDTTWYMVVAGAEWEVGIGTYNAGVLARTIVLSSSNSGSKVNFSAGTKTVAITLPASSVFTQTEKDDTLMDIFITGNA